MVIPMGGMGVPLMGPPTPELQPRFQKIKLCMLVLMAALLGKFIGASMLGMFILVVSGSLNVVLNVVFGIFLLNDDPTFRPMYECLMRTFCSSCADQCQGGLSCLMSFMICNLITVVLNVLLGNPSDWQFAYVGFHEMTVKSGLELAAWGIFTLSVVATTVAQLLASWHAWQAYKLARDSAAGSQGGGEWAANSGGGGSAYQGRDDQGRQDRPMAPASQATGFVPFGGGGNRLGG